MITPSTSVSHATRRRQPGAGPSSVFRRPSHALRNAGRRLGGRAGRLQRNSAGAPVGGMRPAVCKRQGQHTLVARDQPASRRLPGVSTRSASSRRRSAPAVDARAARRRPTGRPARRRRRAARGVTFTPVNALSLTRRPRRCASVARLALPVDAGAGQQRRAAAARRCRAPRPRVPSRTSARPTGCERRGDVASSIGPPPLRGPQRGASRRRACPGPRRAGVRSSASADQRALGVVADRRVGRVLVAAVVLDPGVEARLRRRSAPAGPACRARR